MGRVQIILRQTLPDCGGGTANYRILVGVVIGIAVEHRNTEGSFLEAVEMVICGLLDYIAQESGTPLARSELRAVQDSCKLIDRLLPRADRQLGRCSTAGFSVLRSQAHNRRDYTSL